MKHNFLIAIILIFIFGFGIFQSTNFIFAEELTQIKIVADNTYIYTTPSTALKLNNDDETNTNILGTATLNQTYEYVSTSGNFYEIKFTNETNGFVLIAYCANSSLTPLENVLDTNAVLTKNCEIYQLVENEYVLQTEIIEKGTRVKLISGANTKNTYSQIIVNINNENITCYVLTDNINADGINSRTIVALLLIFTCTIIFLIIYSFYKNKKTKNN